MNYIKNQILQNNALEAWTLAVRYCDYILAGKAALEYRKHFVYALHNSVEFNKMIDMTNDLFKEYYKSRGVSVKGDLFLLNRLRNREMHFFIDKNTFLSENEFQQFHNFMAEFYNILHFYSLLPFWGKFDRWEYAKLQFNRQPLADFT